MASITERNGKFLARVRRDGFKPVAKSFDSKRDAKAWALKVEADMQAGRWQDAAQTVPTMADALKEYRRDVVASMKGAEGYGFIFVDVAAQGFATKPVNAVTAADVAGWRDSMAKRGLAAGTVLRRLGLLSGFFTYAHKDKGWTTGNPLQSVRKPRVSDARDRVLTADEQRHLLAVAGTSRADWLPDALTVLLQTAMRRGELWSLTVADVDTVAGMAHLSDTKNGSARDVPLTPTATAALQRLMDSAKARRETRLIPMADPDGVSLAFRRTLERARDSYASACKRDGVQPVKGFLQGVRLHDIRHTSVTAFAATGALSVFELQQISGHKTQAMLSRYVNLKPADLAKKLAALPALA